MGLKDRSGDFIRFIVYLVVIVLINVAGVTLFYRIDLTGNKIYSISEASKKVVSTLSEPLTVNIFFTKNLPAPHNNTERYLHDLLEGYAIHGNKYFNYRFYDVSPEEGDLTPAERENQEMARSYGIYPIQIQAVEKDEIKFQRAYMGLALIHGDIIEQIPTITSTDRLEYKLTTAIQKLNNKISALLGLPEKVKVKLFLSSSLEIVAPYMNLQDLPKLPKALEKTVEELNLKNFGKLEFEHLDSTKEESLETKLEKYNIINLEWPEIPEKNIKPGKGAIGLIMEYADKTIEVPLLQVLQLPLIGTHYELVDIDNLEEIINENLESLIDINEDLGYLADHGTPSLYGGQMPSAMGRQGQGGLTNFSKLASQTYSIKSVSLKDETIPESLNCLVIAGPKEPFSDYDLYQIDQFLMRGKNLAIFLDAFTENAPGNEALAQSTQQTRYFPLDTGIEKLLAHYGVGVKRSYVMDKNCYKQQLPAEYGGGERVLYFAPMIMNKFINKDQLFMKNIKALVVAKISPLEIDEGRIKENGLKAHKLFSSSEESWEMKDWIDLNPMYLRPPDPDTKMSSMPLAYLIEGEFPSYFAGKPTPEKEIKKDKDSEKEEMTESSDKKPKKPDIDMSKIEGKGGFIAKGKPGKIFLIASSEMLKDNILDSEGLTTNSTFIMNLLDSLNNREATAVMRSKEHRFNPLARITAGAKTAFKSFNIVGLPILVVVFGLLVWFRRHSRKKKIQIMFQREAP